MGGGVGGKVEKGGGEEEGDGEMDCCWVEGMTIVSYFTETNFFN